MEENKTYWKGLEELNNSPEFEKHRHNEFSEKLPTSKVLKEEELDLSSGRRDFLKFMGFGITAATLAACSKSPVKNAVPFVDKPSGVEPGIPDWYASTCGRCSAKCSILVKTRDGRPIKIEGNGESPFNQGGVCATGHASVLSVYDLGRLSAPYSKAKKSEISWKELDTAVINALSNGGNIRILTSSTNSPTLLAAYNKLTAKYPTVKVVQYDAISVSGLRTAHEKAFGKSVLPNFKISEARSLVSFDADFLGTWISPVEYTKQYTSARKTDGNGFLQHFQFESNLSLTGSNADIRATLAPSQMGKALVKLYNLIAAKAGKGTIGESSLELAGNSITAAANSLWKNKGKALVICGSNDVNHQMIVAGINDMLGSYGTTIDLDNPSFQKLGNDKEFINLVSEMSSGSVNTLILHGCNPAYTFPKGFTEALKNVPFSVATSETLDETATQCTYVAPDHNFLESWGDDMPKANYITISQPAITPIYNTRSFVETLLVWAGSPMEQLDFMKQVWMQQFGSNPMGKTFTAFWQESIERGFVTKEASPLTTQVFNANLSEYASNALNGGKIGTKDSPELVIYEKVSLKDGKDANNPWLQEMPDTVTKVSWDNYVALSPKHASELGIENEDVIEVKAGNYTIELPALLLPGVRYGVIAIAAGYGRGKNMQESNLKVAYNVGKNAFPFARVEGESIIYSGTVVNIKKTGAKYDLALTQTHHHMEGRDLVRETTIADYASGAYDKNVAELKHESAHMRPLTLWKDYRFPGHHWGMVVDLNACTGCNACVISCQVENNVPVVGKNEVRLRREMHWIRIDRYFSLGKKEKEHEHKHRMDFVIQDGYSNEYKEIDALAEQDKIDYENVRVVFQPLMCQHCENAPCESVCPVNAISHSSEGLNQQIYNRCVGTRYCANNCPYKVRRFNWFNYGLNEQFKDYVLQNDLGRMVLNPDVTVRSRGVMEKCTMCVQRIQMGKLDSKKAGTIVKDGQIKTACQQSCPANAIVFGDMNDPNSEISKLLKNNRNYTILDVLNVRPVVSYLAKVRNLDKQTA